MRLLRLLLFKVYSRVRYKDNGYWVFGEWFGDRCCDNSMYFANYIAENYPEIKCVWISNRGTDLDDLNGRIIKCEKGTTEANDLICNAHFLFMNQGAADLTDNRVLPSGPISINFWHGIPWKKIGLDGTHNISLVKYAYYKLQNSLLAADYFLSPSDDLSAILISSCGARQNKIIKEGYPRNSVFFDDRYSSICRRKLLQYLKDKYRLDFNDFESIKIITYMPTFRDSTEEQFDFLKLHSDVINNYLSEHNAILIQKSHFASKYVANSVCTNRVFTESEYPAQKLLCATDILITDYSSCFFFFFLLDRPIIHYLYDYDFYKNSDRGLYYAKEDVTCGKVAENIDDLLNDLTEYLRDGSVDHDLRLRRRNQFLPYESPHSCANIYDSLSKLK